MAKYFTRTLAFLLILSFNQFDAKASHVMGGDISWEPAKGGAFKVQITIYRDCHGIDLETPEFETKCATSQKKLSPKVSLINKNIADITPICDQFCSSCNNNCSGSKAFQYGVQKIQATYLVDLSNISCCKVQFDYQNCCRNKQITTGSGKQDFYIKAWLDKCKAPDHNSPDFSNEPLGIICSGKPYVANHGTALNSTENKDSLVFQMTKPLQGPSKPFQYDSPFSFNRPIRFEGFPDKRLDFPAGFHTNNQTGSLKFTPSQKGQTTVMAFEANEYRNGKQICHVRRDMQFSTIGCNNNAVPSISQLNCSQPTPVATCPGDTSKFSVCIKDPNGKDSLKFTLKDKAVPGKLTYNHKKVSGMQDKLNFTWIPPKHTGKNGKFPFYIKVKDDNCPVNGVAGKSFKLKLKKQPVPKISKANLQCDIFQLKAKPQQFKSQELQFQWNIHNKVQSTFESFYYQISEAGNRPFSLNVTSPQCNNTINDTLKTDDFVQVDLGNDTMLCSNASIQLHGKVKNNKGKTQYLWHDGVTGKQTRTFDHLTKDTAIFLTVKDSACSFTDTINIAIKPKPELSLGKDRYLCQEDTLSFNVQETDIRGNGQEPPFVIKQNSQTINYQWTFLPNDKNIKAANQSAALFKRGKYSLTTKDSFGCYDTDTFKLSKPPKDGIGSKPETICKGDTGVLFPESSKKPSGNWHAEYTWINQSSSSHYQRQAVTVEPQDSINYRLISQWTNPSFPGNRCQTENTLEREVNVKPNIQIDSLPALCANATPLDLSSFAHPKGGYWNNNSSGKLNKNKIDPTNFRPGNHAITYHYKDNQTGCKNLKTTSIFIQKPPKVDAGTDTLVCLGSGPLLLDGAPQIPNAQWKGDGISIINGKEYFDPSKAAVDSGLNQLIYEIPNTSINSCSNSDTLAIKVIKPMTTNIPNSINICPSDTQLYKMSRTFSKTGQWYSKANDIAIKQGRLIKKNSDASGKYKAYYKPHQQCSYLDTVTLNILQSPDLKIIKPDLERYCKGSDPIKLKAEPGGGHWEGDNVSNHVFDPGKAAIGNHTIKYHKKGDDGCMATESIKVKVAANPTVKFSKDLINICKDKKKLSFQVAFNNAKKVNFNAGDGISPNRFKVTKKEENSLKGTFNLGSQSLNNQSFYLKAKAHGNYPTCPVSKDSTKLRINPDPQVTFNSPSARKACESEVFSVKGITKNDSKVSMENYSWQVGGKKYSGALPEIKLNTPGYHDVRVIGKTTKGCIDTIKKEDFFQVLPKPDPDFNANKVRSALPNKVKFVNLTDTFGAQTQYRWIFQNQEGESFTKKVTSPNIKFRDTGIFDVTLLAKNSKGCENEKTKKQYIEILPRPMVYIPNAFTPNGDGDNDEYRVQVKYFKDFKLRIFNNWGETLYLANSYKDHGWKGQYKGSAVPTGSYMYKLKVHGLNDNMFEYSGTLNLIR